MAAKFHFFTQADIIDTQPDDKAYGPVKNSESTEYRLTSMFTVSVKAEAYAVCDGTVFVQEIPSTDYVNLILKPTVSDLENGFTPVEYFIYRGLKKENFVTNAGTIVPQNDANSTGLTNGIWADAAIFQTLDPSFVSTEKAFGWDKNSLPGTTLLTEIFYENNNDIQLTHVYQGTLLGYFGSGLSILNGFEIVLKDRLYLPDLNMVRAEENKIVVSAPGGTDIPGNEPIATMREREKILNFVDPAAYFMLFYEGGIHVRNKNLPSVNCFGYSDIYNTVVSNFHTSNTLYIDIRNENGYSLNYYKDNEGLINGTDYGKHINYSFDGNNFSPIEYYTNYWPIFSITPLANTANNYTIIHLKFQNQYNPTPLVYLDFAQQFRFNIGNGELYFPTGSWKFLDETVSVPAPLVWSNGVHLGCPNINSLSGNTQPAWIIKIMNIRPTIAVGIPLPPSVVLKTHYADNLFGPIQPLPNYLGNGQSQWVTGTGKKYINAFRELGIAGIFETGLGVSSDDVLFYGIMKDFYYPNQAEEVVLLTEEYITNVSALSGRS